MNSPQDVWNSLEIVRLVVSGLTPLVVAAVGFWLNRRLKKIEQLQWASQQVVEKRIEFYYSAVPKLNDLLCYFTYVGSWKDLTPPEVVRLKRVLDKEFYINAPILPPEILERYFLLVSKCYRSFSGWGADAKLRTRIERRKEASGKSWETAWEFLFYTENVLEPREIQDDYNGLVGALANTLGIGVNSAWLPRGRVPRNEKNTRPVAGMEREIIGDKT